MPGETWEEEGFSRTNSIGVWGVKELRENAQSRVSMRQLGFGGLTDVGRDSIIRGLKGM